MPPDGWVTCQGDTKYLAGVHVKLAVNLGRAVVFQLLRTRDNFNRIEWSAYLIVTYEKRYLTRVKKSADAPQS